MEYDHDIGIFGIVLLTIMGLLQYFSGKNAGRKEVIEEVRDAEVAELRRQIQEFQRSQRH